MMISISGERGVGKTLYLAERVYRRRKEGYFTVTNFSHSHSNLDCSGLSPEEFLDVILNIIDFKDNGYEMFNIHPSFRHTGVYVAMDEATIYFSAEMQSRLAKKNPKKYERLLNLLAQARKYDVEIDYVVQDPAKVGKDFRRYTEHFIYLRWLFKIKRLANVPHPRLPIFRREHRHLLDIIWMEVHDLDAENPVRNYRTISDENGIAQWSESSTLISRSLRLTGKYKKKYLRMYNSYQPVAVKQEMYSKEFSPLKSFRIMTDIARENLPTFKAMLRAVGIRVRNRDAELPPKIGFTDIVLPSYDPKNKIISEVQTQEIAILDVEELKSDIARAYSGGEGKKSMFTMKRKGGTVKHAAPFPAGVEKEGKSPAKTEPASVAKETRASSVIKKFTKKNDPKEILRNKNQDKPSFIIPLTPEDYVPKEGDERTGDQPEMEQPHTEIIEEKGGPDVPKMRRKGRKGMDGNMDKLRMPEPLL